MVESSSSPPMVSYHSLILRRFVTVIFTVVLSPPLVWFAYPALFLACPHCVTSWGGWGDAFVTLRGAVLYTNGGRACYDGCVGSPGWRAGS